MNHIGPAGCLRVSVIFFYKQTRQSKPIIHSMLEFGITLNSFTGTQSMKNLIIMHEKIEPLS